MEKIEARLLWLLKSLERSSSQPVVVVTQVYVSQMIVPTHSCETPMWTTDAKY